MPLTTRDGNDDAPIDPGARWNIDPWVAAPPAKWWRLTTPWNPLPRPVPMTSTRSPLAKIDDEHLIAGLQRHRRRPPALTSRRTRVGGTPAFL